MACRARTLASAQELDEVIPSSLPSRRRARVTPAARFVHLASRDASQADARPLGAPDRPVAIPDAGWRACECLAWGDDDGGDDEGEARPAATRTRRRRKGLRSFVTAPSLTPTWGSLAMTRMASYLLSGSLQFGPVEASGKL